MKNKQGKDKCNPVSWVLEYTLSEQCLLFFKLVMFSSDFNWWNTLKGPFKGQFLVHSLYQLTAAFVEFENESIKTLFQAFKVTHS